MELKNLSTASLKTLGGSEKVLCYDADSGATVNLKLATLVEYVKNHVTTETPASAE